MEEQQYALNDIELMRLPFLSNIPLEHLNTIKQRAIAWFYQDGEVIIHQDTAGEFGFRVQNAEPPCSKRASFLNSPAVSTRVMNLTV